MLTHFKLADFRCKCDRGAKCDAPQMDMETLMKLEGLRLEFGKPMTINSGCRCSYWNDKEGGEENSQHLYGRAIDVHCPDGAYMRRLVILAIKHGFTGIGVKRRMVHLDTRPVTEVMFGY